MMKNNMQNLIFPYNARFRPIRFFFSARFEKKTNKLTLFFHINLGYIMITILSSNYKEIRGTNNRLYLYSFKPKLSNLCLYHSV